MIRKPRFLNPVALTVAALLGVGCPSSDVNKKLGVVLPLSGEDASYGESIKHGIELGLEHVNAREEVPVEFTLDIQDSGSTPEGAVQAYQTAASDAIAVIGGATSPEALALAPVADDADKVLLSPTASSPELSRISQQFFRIFPSSGDEAVALTRFLNDKAWLQPEVIVSLTSQEPYGQGAAAAVGEVIDGGFDAEVTFAAGQEDLSAEVEEVLAQFPEQSGDPKAEVVFVAARGSDLARAIRALRLAGFNQNHQWVFATSALASPVVMGNLGSDANRVFFAQGAFDVDSSEEPMASFVSEFETRYGKKPDLYAAHGYDAIQVLGQAAAEAKDVQFPSDILTGMRSISNYQGVTGNIQFRESGDVQKFARIFYVDDGEVVDYQRWEEERQKEAAEKLREIQRRQEELNRRLDQVQN